MIVTTTPSIEGRAIRDYRGIVIGEVIVGANLFRDLFASITDIVGGRSGKYEEVLQRAREQALGEMRMRAAEMGTRITKALQSHDWLVAEADEEVIGYAYGSEHRKRAAYQTSCDVAVYVGSDHGRQGIGRSLYEALLPRLKARKKHAAFAGIALPNKASIALHQAMEFELVGIYKEVGWKLGDWRDVAWFQRLL